MPKLDKPLKSRQGDISEQLHVGIGRVTPEDFTCFWQGATHLRHSWAPQGCPNHPTNQPKTSRLQKHPRRVPEASQKLVQKTTTSEDALLAETENPPKTSQKASETPERLRRSSRGIRNHSSGALEDACWLQCSDHLVGSTACASCPSTCLRATIVDSSTS